MSDYAALATMTRMPKVCTGLRALGALSNSLGGKTSSIELLKEPGKKFDLLWANQLISEKQFPIICKNHVHEITLNWFDVIALNTVLFSQSQSMLFQHAAVPRHCRFPENHGTKSQEHIQQVIYFDNSRHLNGFWNHCITFGLRIKLYEIPNYSILL